MGRHKLAPVISPKKTVEGAVAQVVASVISGAALGAWLLPGCGAGLWLGAGALLGVIRTPDGRQSQLFFVGTQLTFTPQADGRLFLLINDDNYSDNSGSFDVRIVY
jgi:CDP-diglyceride synthetase